MLSISGTAVPYAGTAVTLTRRAPSAEAPVTESSEDVLNAREEKGSLPVVSEEDGRSDEDILTVISGRETVTGKAKKKGSSELSGKAVTSDKGKVKDTGDSGKDKKKDAREPEGGNTMGSSLNKETASAASRETAHIRDDYMSAHKGMDISQFNGDIDWKQVKESGSEAVIIRVGGRYGSSEGGIYKDKKRDENIKGALNAGLEVGVYFYSQAVTVEEGIEEAKFCIDAVKNYDITLPIIIDYEWEPGYRLADGGTPEQRTAVIKAFCKTVTKAGYRGGIYASDYCFKDYLIPDQIYGKYYIWLAHWTSAELPGIAYFGPFDGWQYSSTGTVPGISGPVDLDYFYWIDKFFVNYYIEDDLKFDSTPISLGIKTKTLTAEELGIQSMDSRLFAGWHVFREKDDCWAAYKLSDETKKTVWVEPAKTGELPEGYDYKIYPDGVKISTTAKGGNVNFYAAWTEDGFVVRYHDGKTRSDTKTPVYYGQTTATTSYKELGFAKDGYEFAGWKVCRSCDNKWAVYEEGDESKKTRWVELDGDRLPEGYLYKYFPNKVSIGTTASTGFVDFYAHWEKKAS